MRKNTRNSIRLAPAKFRSNIDPFCSHKCRYTTDRQLLPSADGVFLQPVEITEGDRTMWLFQANILDGPNRYSPNQIFFVYLYEAPKHTFNKRLTYLPSHQINYTVGFIPGCDIYAGYGDFPLKNASYFGRETKTPKQTPEEEWERVKSIVLNKTEPAFAVVSHCRTNSHREDYFDTFKLSKRDMAKKMATHHFYFAFENAICNGYVTEKFIERARGLVVPVVLRRSDYRTLLPDDSYISADDFDTMHELADYLKYLMKNKEVYLRYFEWTKHYERKGPDHLYRALCESCTKLYDTTNKQSYTDVYQWYSWKKNCDSEFVTRLLERQLIS
ncbi:Alpha1,3-fucosyltransferase-like proteinue [Aphelenchoides besseyi]|nr:Alpha1,3-fucosyltransferase-like proteinue [Aphelenchoides besseyi]